MRRLSAPDTAAIAAFAAATAAALATPDASDASAAAAAASAATPAATPCVDWVVTRVAPLAHLLPGCLLSRAPPLRLSQDADAGADADAAAAAATTAAFLRGWAQLSREGSPVAMAARPADGSAAEIVLWHTDAGEPKFLFLLIGSAN